VAILETSGDEHIEVGPGDGAKDQAFPGSLLETGFSLEYGGIVVERGAENLSQSDRLSGTQKASRGDRDKEPWRYVFPNARHVVLCGAQVASLLSSAACGGPRKAVQKFSAMNVRRAFRQVAEKDRLAACAPQK
jgi:hypothetical protein